MNDDKSRQPMYMRSSVSSAFDEKYLKKKNILTTLAFIGFIILVILIIVWVIFFDGLNYGKNFIIGLFGPEIK